MFRSDTQLRFTDRVKTGVTGEQIWLQINEPTPQDKGKYTMELFDGKTGHRKTVDLSGQGRLFPPPTPSRGHDAADGGGDSAADLPPARSVAGLRRAWQPGRAVATVPLVFPWS